MRPFMTIVTRCCKRPQLLRQNIRSIMRQTCWDVEQIFAPDRVGFHPEGNLTWANNQYIAQIPRIDGLYAYSKDDDVTVVSKHFVEEVRACAIQWNYPHLILVRSICVKDVHSGALHYLPLVWDHDWEHGERPEKWSGHAANFVVRADFWTGKIGAYRDVPHGGDWHFGTAMIHEPGIRIVRCDVVASASMLRGRGKRFEECEAGWFEEITAEFGIENLGADTPETEDWRLRLWER